MGNIPLSAIDVVVAVVLLGSAGFAFMRGFVHEVLAIAAWAGAVFAALYGFEPVKPFFRAHIGMVWAADALAALSLFLVTLLVLSIATKAASRRVQNSALGSVDSSLGFVFGLARGAILVCLAYMIVVWVVDPKPDEPPAWLASSKTRPWLERGSSMLRDLAPEGFGAAEGQARSVSDDVRRAQELEKTYRSLTAPQPTAPAAAGGTARKDEKAPGGYDNSQRKDMDRLFQSNQQ